MELKDAILQTLAEIDEVVKIDTTSYKKDEPALVVNTNDTQQAIAPTMNSSIPVPNVSSSIDDRVNEKIFLSHAKDRLIVLFEGLNTPGVTQLEAKLDLTLNFLEYLLASIDERLDKVDK